jgi:fatty-acyl-CoA synthase
MRSTMQDIPLSIPTILRHGRSVHGTSEILTYTGSGFRTATFAEVADRAAQLAHGLRDRLGVVGDQRVATFMWNNQEHVEAYLAVPSMGAVLHTLNIRLPEDQLTYIARHAEDRVIILDGSLAPLLAGMADRLPTVEHIVMVGEGDAEPFRAAGKTVTGYAELLAGQPTEFAWVEPADERDGAAMCYTSGTTGNPKGVVYSHRSIYLHSMHTLSHEAFPLSDGARVVQIVPMFHAMAWGKPTSLGTIYV